jgi:hypothetical protein
MLTGGDASKSVLVSRPRTDVLRVRALVLAHFAVVEVKDSRDGVVEELQVMAHHEKRAAERAQETHQPFFSVDVEVVRGFVEHQIVGPTKENVREFDSSPFAQPRRAKRLLGSTSRAPLPQPNETSPATSQIAALDW